MSVGTTLLCTRSHGEVECGPNERQLQRIDLLLAATGVSARLDYACAVLVDGSARCWGSNNRGQIGGGIVPIPPVTKCCPARQRPVLPTEHGPRAGAGSGAHPTRSRTNTAFGCGVDTTATALRAARCDDGEPGGVRPVLTLRPSRTRRRSSSYLDGARSREWATTRSAPWSKVGPGAGA